MDLDKENMRNRKNEENSQEPLLNLSASQLVELMTCAMKRKSSLPASPQDESPKKQCLSSTTDNEPNHTLHGSKQALVKRNEYLEKRVKELEVLNYNLQFGIIDSVKNAVTEIMQRQFNMNDLVFRKQSSEHTHKHIGRSNNYVGCSSQQQPPTWQQDSDQEETMISNVTSTTMKLSDSSIEEFNDTLMVVDRGNKESIDVDSEQFMRSRSHGVVVQYIKPEDSSNVDGTLQIYENPNYNSSDMSAANSTHTFAPCNGEKRTENICNNQINKSNQVRVLGMAHEIQTIVREATNYKKLTNRLLNALFDREELASSTLTGKFKGEYEKEKLDEDTVNLIVQQAVARFPGTSPTDIRIVISQNCKDKALRLQRRQAKMVALYGE